MSLITEVQALTAATTGLLTAVQASKAQLDGAVATAEEARDQAVAETSTTLKLTPSGLRSGEAGLTPEQQQALIGGLGIDGWSTGARTKLRRFAAKLKTARTRQCSVAVLGHSVVAGAYSNNAVANADTIWNQSGFVGVLRKDLAAIYGEASRAGMLHPAEHPATNFTLAGGATFNGPNNPAGVGGYRIDMPAAANTCSVAGFGRYLRVYGFALASGTKARWTVDGGSLTTDPGAGASGASPNGQFWYTFDVDLGTTGDHTVVLQGADAGSWYFWGAAFLTTTDSGVLVHRLGWSGSVLPDLIANSMDVRDTAGPVWRTTLTANGKTQQAQSLIQRLNLDLLVCMTDVNDLTRGWTTYGYTLADIRRHAANVAALAIAAGVDCVFAVGPWRSPAAYGAGVQFNQQDVIDQYLSVAAENDRCAVLNLAHGYASYDQMNADGLMQDLVHPSGIGHGFMGGGASRAFLKL